MTAFPSRINKLGTGNHTITQLIQSITITVTASGPKQHTTHQMIIKEPKNEQRLCESAIRLLVERIGESIIKAEAVDTVVRDRPAVEWIYETPSTRFAVEHTRIESFPDPIAEGKRFAQQLLQPLQKELAGRLPERAFSHHRCWRSESASRATCRSQESVGRMDPR